MYNIREQAQRDLVEQETKYRYSQQAGSTHLCKVIIAIEQQDGYMTVLFAGDTWVGLEAVPACIQEYCIEDALVYVDLDNDNTLVGLGRT